MGATARVDAIVVPDNHLMYNVIVGRDFLEQEHIITIKKGNKLIFKQLTPVNDDFAENIEDVNYLSSKKMIRLRYMRTRSAKKRNNKAQPYYKNLGIVYPTRRQN